MSEHLRSASGPERTLSVESVPYDLSSVKGDRLAMDTDNDFYNRADAVIRLANDQLAEVSRGKVSASCMYASSRFSAWVSACGFESGEDMAAAKQETIEYFVKQFRSMLEENLDDYIDNFKTYMDRKVG